MNMLPQQDKTILRELAKKQLEVANSAHNQQLAKLWLEHNSMRGKRPMVHIEIDTFANEVITPKLRCESKAGREMEYNLYHSFTNQLEFNDDKPVTGYYPIEWQSFFHPFGHEIGRESAADEQGREIGHQFQHVIADLEEDWDKLSASTFGVDAQATKAQREMAEDAFGDILPVQMSMPSLYAVPTQQIVHLMGMENMCFALYDYPELFSKMMDRLADDYLAFFSMLEKEGYLIATTNFGRLNQGSFCFTEELPETSTLTTHDVWGFLDSQETVSISPDMFAEFIFPSYNKIASCYGLLSYGCCEPVDAFWQYLQTLPNLRKISISPWTNEDVMGEALKNSSIIYHRKPSPNLLGVDAVLDEDAVRKHITKTAKAANGCKLEITQRDVYTVHNNPGKVRRYVEIVRNCLEEHWQP